MRSIIEKSLDFQFDLRKFVKSSEFGDRVGTEHEPTTQCIYYFMNIIVQIYLGKTYPRYCTSNELVRSFGMTLCSISFLQYTTIT